MAVMLVQGLPGRKEHVAAGHPGLPIERRLRQRARRRRRRRVLAASFAVRAAAAAAARSARVAQPGSGLPAVADRGRQRRAIRNAGIITKVAAGMGRAGDQPQRDHMNHARSSRAGHQPRPETAVIPRRGGKSTPFARPCRYLSHRLNATVEYKLFSPKGYRISK